MSIFKKFGTISNNSTLDMTSVLLEGRAARGTSQKVIKCDDYHFLQCVVTLKYFIYDNV